MIDEIQKRPFVRPLFFWITGILLYSYLPLSPLLYISGIFLLVLFVFLCVSSSTTTATQFVYDSRWVWGAFISICILLLSIEISYITDKRIFLEGRSTFPVEKKAVDMQTRIVNKFDHLDLTDEEKSVVAALTIGYKQTMSSETKRRFSTTGISHVLAVSGFHVAIVCAFLSIVCSIIPKRGVGRWIHYCFIILLLWMFALVTGLSSSTVRATLMLTLYLTGKALRRFTDSYNTLAVAAFFMLVYNPAYFYDIGFQLSFLAVFFILYFVPRFKENFVVKNPIIATPLEWGFVSLAAQLGVSGLCFYYFGQFSLIFLLTNIPITFLASLLLPVSLIWLIIPSGFFFEEFLRVMLELLVYTMMQLVTLFSTIPFASVPVRFSALNLVEYYIFIIMSMIYIKERNPKVILWALFSLLILSFHILIENF